MTDAASFKLVIEDDEGRRSVVPVDLGEVSIGRLDGNTIRLNERNVSRRHARLFKQSNNIVAEDLDSYNGVFINGERIKGQHEVRSGDVLRIGDFQLELRGEGLASRTEETTQRTQLPEVEATQPDIRMMDGAPTPRAAAVVEAPVEEPKPREEPTAIIRMSHLEDVEASRRDAKAAISGQKAKLVCVSTQFAGRQFEITKTEVVLGRTDDNDIAIDHRSVSRHHAKLVTSGKSVKLVDLKSANGTLVNGEEYAQTDLKNGDLIEFGHVKFRFVPAGETYTFSPDELAAIEKSAPEAAAAGATMPERGAPTRAVGSVLRTHQLVLAAIVGLAVVVGILIVWLIATSGDKPKPQTTDAQVIEPVAAAPTAGGSETERMLSRAQVAFAQRQWQQAVDLARAVVALEAGNQSALELVNRATSEQKAQSIYDLAVSAINASQWEQAWGYLQQIPGTSVYAAQAGPLTNQVQAALVTDKLQQASAAVEDRDWSRAEALVQEVRGLDPARPEAVALLAQVDAGRRDERDKPGRSTPRTPSTKSNRPVAAVPDKPAPPPTPPPAVPAEPAAPAGDPKALYNKGAAFLKANQFQAAIDAFSECIKVDKRNCPCFRAMGITYARAGNGPKAYRYYKQYLKVCPDAPDAPAVMDLLKQYEAQQ